VNALFTATNITKRYEAVTVLDEVQLDVRRGEVHALLGANGAGKSTLCKIISGLTPASNGSMQLDGIDFRPISKQAAELAGVQIVQQELNQIPTLTVAENISLCRLPNTAGIINRKRLAQRARGALDRIGLSDITADTIVGTLGVGRQQMIEIATALDRECKLLILDEPTASLSPAEVERLFEQLEQLRRDGIGIVYISHRLNEVARMADRVTVLRDGKYVCTQDASALTTEQMVELMSGEEAVASSEFESFASDTVAMRVTDISGGIVQDVSFSVRRGERLGIAGLVGSGRTELLRLIFGADLAESGSVGIGGQTPKRFAHPQAAVDAGLAMVTEDRKQNGLLLSQSVRVNTTLCSLFKRFSLMGVLRGFREREVTQEMVDDLQTKCEHLGQTIETLSGGNQQKVAISKWLVWDPDVFFFDEPTRGIDVSARRRIYSLLDSLAKSGKAIVIVSSDLDELLETCDRIGVMSAGRWVEEFSRDSWSTDRIMQAAFSNYKQAEAVV
jgi:ribose transport system ATP-binding protein